MKLLSFVGNTTLKTMAAAPSAAAAPTVTGAVVGDLNNTDYLNWLKANKALHCTIDVLRQVCFTEMQNFHNLLLQKHGDAQCSVPCSHSDIRPHGKLESWSIPCPSSVCSDWLADIVRGRIKKSTRLSWQNSDFSQWQKEPWQIAKIYMDHGQDVACVNPADTDAAGIVRLMLNFDGFKNVLDTTKVDAVSLCSFCILTLVHV